MNQILTSIMKRITRRTFLVILIGLTPLLVSAPLTTAQRKPNGYVQYELPAQVEIITVTTLNDDSDFSGLQQVNDLPGPDGRVSFREAVTAANNTPGPQTIAEAA